MHKTNLYLERFWLVVTILVFFFCIYEFIVDGSQIGKWYLVALIIPILMYLFRRFLRKRQDKMEQPPEQKK